MSCLRGEITDTSKGITCRIECVTEPLRGTLTEVCSVVKPRKGEIYSSDGFLLMDKNGVIILSKI